MKNIYLATPVNGRKEKTLRQKMKAAYQRINEMATYIHESYPDANLMSSFDIPAVMRYINILDEPPVTEPFIMGLCTQFVMECDMIVLDDGWECSQGCTVERFVAMQYGKQVKTINSFKLAEKLKD